MSPVATVLHNFVSKLSPDTKEDPNLPATLTKVEALTGVNSHWLVNLALHLGVVTGHDHLACVLSTLWEIDGNWNI